MRRVVLLLLTFFLHVIPMNLVLGGSIIGAIARVRGRRPDRPHEAALAHIVVKAMPMLISVTVSLGVAALLVVAGVAFSRRRRETMDDRE